MRISYIKRRSLVITSVVSFSLALGISLAQAYPTKPIRLIVPFPAGDATDSWARALSQKLGEKIGQTLGVENLPSPGCTIRADTTSKSVIDGHRLLLATGSTHSIGPAISSRIPYNAETNFIPIGFAASSPNVIVVPNTLLVKSMHELIDYAHKSQGEHGYASNGNGTVLRLTSELFKAPSNTFILHILYRGWALAIPDLVSDKVDLLFNSTVTDMPYTEDCKLCTLAVTSVKRSSLAPVMPPVAETLWGFESVTWFGLSGPTKLPVNLIGKISANISSPWPTEVAKSALPASVPSWLAARHWPSQPWSGWIRASGKNHDRAKTKR